MVDRTFAIVGVLLLVAGCSPTTPDRPNVVLIVIDTLRASHLGFHGYGRDTTPFLDSLAAQSLDFRRAIATSSWTSPSVASIFSSLYPPAHGIAPGRPEIDSRVQLVLGAGFVTLAEVLQQSGYRTAAVVANPWISQRLGFAQGFDQFIAPHANVPGIAYAHARLLNRIAFDLLKPLREDSAGDQPFFLYLHYMDPHLPNEARPRYRELFKQAPAGHAHTDLSDPETRAMVDLYDAEIRYLDDQLGKLFEFFDEHDLTSKTVFIVTGDHGEQFFEYGNRDHGHTVHNLEVHVPLLMKIPGVEAAVIDDAFVSTLDIYPTVLEILGIPTGHPIQGVSLRSDLALRAERGVYSGMTFWGNHKSFTRADGRKIVLSYDAIPSERVRLGEERGLEVFDSVADYVEKKPLDSTDHLWDLRSKFYAVYDESLSLRDGRTPEPVELDDATLERLRKLGYAE